MSSGGSPENDDFKVNPEGGRANVDDYGNDAYEYSPGDTVWLQRPNGSREKYEVWGTQDGKYILCHCGDDSVLVDEGHAFAASQLKLYDPFEDDE